MQDRQANLKQRYPAKGLHWLLGLVRLARGMSAKRGRNSIARLRLVPTSSMPRNST